MLGWAAECSTGEKRGAARAWANECGGAASGRKRAEPPLDTQLPLVLAGCPDEHMACRRGDAVIRMGQIMVHGTGRTLQRPSWLGRPAACCVRPPARQPGAAAAAQGTAQAQLAQVDDVLDGAAARLTWLQLPG